MFPDTNHTGAFKRWLVQKNKEKLVGKWECGSRSYLRKPALRLTVQLRTAKQTR